MFIRRLNSKAQTSIEFIVLTSLVILLTFFFTSSLFSTFDTNVATYKVKSNALQELVFKNSKMMVSDVSYDIYDSNIFFTIEIDRLDHKNLYLDTNDFNNTIVNLESRSKFDDVNISIIYR